MRTDHTAIQPKTIKLKRDMADTTIDVLNLSKVEALEDGEAYNVEDITAAMKRNRLTITF